MVRVPSLLISTAVPISGITRASYPFHLLRLIEIDGAVPSSCLLLPETTMLLSVSLNLPITRRLKPRIDASLVRCPFSFSSFVFLLCDFLAYYDITLLLNDFLIMELLN